MDQNIKDIIVELCRGKEDILENHILPVAEYSTMLARRLGADIEVVEIAAWLHDIKKLRGEPKEHHVYGAEEAGEMMERLGYADDKITQVKECILTHSSDERYPPRTLEAKIVATADALAIFDHFHAMNHVVYSRKGLSIEEGRRWLINKYEVAWSKLMPEGKDMAQEKYKAIMLLLKSDE